MAAAFAADLEDGGVVLIRGPLRGGRQTLALDVRPVVGIEETGGRRRVSDVVASTETFDISVVVRVPPEEAAREGLDRTTGLLLTTSGVLTAIAAVAAGVLGCGGSAVPGVTGRGR
ncbi:MAG: hypothetical protein QOC93_224 [Actinomycetota bacterium]|nr:hypothetical protein [Actinomycetota bacterium]